MAKHVVVFFQNDLEADSFTETMQGGSEDASMKVVGVFKSPTMFCECPPQNNPKSVRGQKWGWWLHKDCGKPRKGNVHHPYNLLLTPEQEKHRVDFMYIGAREPRDATPEV